MSIERAPSTDGQLAHCALLLAGIDYGTFKVLASTHTSSSSPSSRAPSLADPARCSRAMGGTSHPPHSSLVPGVGC